jgi:hypothetical protein
VDIVSESNPEQSVYTPRPVRVAVDAPQVRIAGTIGRLLEVSATGALVQVPDLLPPEREWRMLLTVEPEPIDVGVRVVRTTVVPIHLRGATWGRQECAVALAFTDLAPKAKAAIERLCGEAFGKSE